MGGRGRRFAALLGIVLLAACSSTPPEAPEPPADPDEPRVSVSALARRHHLHLDWDEHGNRLTLSGTRATVTLFPRTTVAVVNGGRVAGLSRIEGPEWQWTLAGDDAARIERAMRVPRPAPYRPPPVAAKPPPSAAPVVEVKSSPPSVDSAWRVPLGNTWKYIVIHHSGTRTGNADAFARHHKRANGWDGLGYHFVIGNGRGSGDGHVEVGYRWKQQLTGAHAGRGRNDDNEMNEKGVGIALVGDFDRSRPSPAQIRSLHRLVDFLREHCGIPAGGVLLHRDVKGTKCPGRYFPAREFLVSDRTVPAAFR